MLNCNSMNRNGMSTMKCEVNDTKFAWDYWYDSQCFKSKGLLVWWTVSKKEVKSAL